MPSESVIKSDLQFYNKDSVDASGNGVVRDVLAYTIKTHGGPDLDIYVPHWLFGQTLEGTLTASEVSALWYHYVNMQDFSEIDVYAWNCIIIVDTCYGYSYNGNSPTMAESFVDDGNAAAFIGSTISTTSSTDDYMRAFWFDLCQDNHHVRSATIDLCNNYGNNWNIGDEWKIYGNQYS